MKATAGVLPRHLPPVHGQGDCLSCGGSGEDPFGRGVLFCDDCGGTGRESCKARRIPSGGSHVTVFGPVPPWLANLLSNPANYG